MARLSEYEYLKQYKGVSIIYALSTDEDGVRYVGHSKNVYKRFYDHLRNPESDSNTHKKNWVSKNTGKIKITILSINPNDWEEEEKKHIQSYSNLLNICKGGLNNIKQKTFSEMSKSDHLNEINASLRFLNKYLGFKRFDLLTNDQIKRLS